MPCAPLQPEDPAPPSPGRGRILIADDDSGSRIVLARLLRGEGYDVQTAADGVEALTKLKGTAPEVLLTDLWMPGLDGLGLMHKARALDPLLETVVMTAHGAVDTAVGAMRDGAVDYLTKPIDVEHLTGVLDRALERRRAREGGPPPAVPGATLAELERHAILATLHHTRGSTSRAAKILGISPRKIQYRLHAYGRAGSSEPPDEG